MKATKPMSVTNVKLLLEALTCEVDGLSAGLKALTASPARFKALTLIDGPRSLHFAAGEVCGVLQTGGVWLADPVAEFAEDGDPLWAFDHRRGGQPVAGEVRQKALTLERAVLAGFGVDSIKAYRAIVLLSRMHGVPVPELSRQGVPEA